MRTRKKNTIRREHKKLYKKNRQKQTKHKIQTRNMNNYHAMLEIKHPNVRKLETIPPMCPPGFSICFSKKCTSSPNYGKTLREKRVRNCTPKRVRDCTSFGGCFDRNGTENNSPVVQFLTFSLLVAKSGHTHLHRVWSRNRFRWKADLSHGRLECEPACFLQGPCHQGLLVLSSFYAYGPLLRSWKYGGDLYWVIAARGSRKPLQHVWLKWQNVRDDQHQICSAKGWENRIKLNCARTWRPLDGSRAWRKNTKKMNNQRPSRSNPWIGQSRWEEVAFFPKPMTGLKGAGTLR